MLVYDAIDDRLFEDDELCEKLNFPEKIEEANRLIVTSPFVDLHTHVRLNGGEDYDTLTRAAISGGFLVVNIQPNTKPLIDNEEVLREHIQLSEGKDVVYNYTVSLFGSINDIDSLPSQLKGKVTGFSTDGIRYHSEDLLKPLSFKKHAIIFDHSQLHEIPGDFYIGSNLSNSIRTYSNEAIAIFRIVMTGLEFGFNRFHIQHISTLQGLETVQYLRKFAHVTCELTPHHAYFTPEMINHPNQKINPPISKYKDELVRALREGIINCFATDHAPHPEKPQRYEDAPYGSSHIEVAFSVYLSVFLDAKLVLKNLTSNPLKVLGKSYKDFGIRFPNDAVVIDPEAEYVVDASKFFSKGKNCAFDGLKLKGKVIGVRRKGRWVYWNGQFVDE